MEIRLFNLFCEKYSLNYKEANDIFNQNDIWDFIEETYDDLHLSSDELALDDICAVLKNNEVLI